jgi:endonuclease III related protein
MNKIELLYFKLLKKHGKPKGKWKLWCKRRKNEKEREEVAIGAILTQRTNWKNVEKAIENLKKESLLSLKKIFLSPKQRIANLIKPTGFYQAKTDYLLNFASFVVKNYGSLSEMKKEKLEKLRKELLKLRGIGKETADSILLYALDKPVFVIDEYTKRIVKRKKLAKNFSYDYLQEMFQRNLRKDFKLYQDFHALLVMEAQNKFSS